MQVLGVIPARYGSTRFEGKVLALLAGKPLVLHALDRAREAARLTRVVVAVDDERVERAALDAGAEVVLTPSHLPSGSDRVAFAARELDAAGDRYGVVVNLQADEPFLPGEAIDRAVQVLAGDPEAEIATLAVPDGPEAGEDPHRVKVVLDKRGRALYFSRSAVPHRGHAGSFPFLRHLGVYAFRRDYLDRFVTLEPGALERAEKLEQLRALEDGAHIVVATGTWPAIGVDTPEDLARAERYFEGSTMARRREKP